MKHRPHIHSITQKNALATALIGFLMIFLLSLVWPKLFYMIARNELVTNISGTVNECSLRLSYLLSNHGATMDLRKNSALLTLIRQYYEEDADQEAIAQDIKPYLAMSIDGPLDGGSIHSTNYTLLVTDQGDCFYNDSERLLAESFMNAGILENIHMDEDGHFYSEQYFMDSDGKCYTPVVDLKTEQEETSYFCFIGAFTVNDMICFAVSLTPFTDIYNQLEKLEQIGISDFALFCQDHILFLNQKKTQLVSLRESVSTLLSQQYEVISENFQNGVLFRVLCSYPSEGLYLAVHATQEELVAPYKNFFCLLELCLCFLILLMVFIFTVIFHVSMKRLKKMDQEMRLVRSGNFDIVLKDQKNDEIGNIAQTINMMVSTIKNHLEQQIASEKQERELQYSLLVSAIDPHFIYNTLDTVTFLAAMGKCQDIIRVNNALIGTLKDRIKMKHLKIYDSVENEKKVIEQYMIIQSYLYSNPIDFQFLVPEENCQLQIPKNLIQPLVENAIKHGLMPNKDPSRSQTKEGRITVRVVTEADSIVISVEDNGIGMDEKKREFYLGEIDSASIDPEHIGLFNVRLRLSYLYQDRFDFQIHCPESGGTIVLIRLQNQ